MKKITFMGALLFTLIGLSFTTRFGLDSYEVFLNNRLVLKGYVNQPLNSRILTLNKAKETDQLQIAYTHCMNKGTGTARNVSLKDENGAVLFKWTFADGTGAKMNLPVKELLHWQQKKAGHELSLYYSAHESAREEMISTIRLTNN